MGVTFQVAETPRVYVERIDINGNTADPRQGHPPRVPPRRGRSVQQRPRQAARATASSRSASSRRIWRSSRSRARRPTGSSSASRSRSRRPASCSFRPASRASSASSSTCRSRQRNFSGRGQELRAAVNYSSYSKSIELGFTEPYLFDRNIALGFDIYRRDLNSFNFVGNDRRHDLRAGHAPAASSAPACRSPSSCRSRCATASTMTRSASTRRSTSPIRTAPGRCRRPAIRSRRPLSVRRARQPPDLVDRLFAGLRTRSTTGFGRAAASGSCSARISPASAATCAICAPASAPRNIGTSSATSSSRSASRAAISTASRTARPTSIRSGSPTASSSAARRSAASTSAASARASSAALSVRRRRDDRRRQQRHRLGRSQHDHRRRDRRPRLLSRPAPSSKSRSARGVRDSACGRRSSSTPAPCCGVRTPALLDIDPNDPLAFNRVHRRPAARSTLRRRRAAMRPTGEALTRARRSRRSARRFLGNTPSPRLSVGFGVNWNSPFGPFRIDIAKALLSEPGDDTKLFTFNVGTAF